jgi:hypothetical protein
MACVLGLAGVVLLAAPTIRAEYVMPKMGGGQTMAPMIHTDVMFDGRDIALDFQLEGEFPMLRPLTPPDEFDPTLAWSVLQGTAYNFQYAWNAGGFITLPGGTGIWVERLHHDEGLVAYLRPPSNPAWSEVFTHDGYRWKWSGAMAHNAYAVLHPRQVQYEATYKVYIGDAATGEPVAGYGSATITWTWRVDACLTHVVWADADNDEDVDQADFGVFQACFGGTGNPYAAEPEWCRCFDRIVDGSVDSDDFAEFTKCATGPSIRWDASLLPECAP